MTPEILSIALAFLIVPFCLPVFILWARLAMVDGLAGAKLFTLPARSLNWVSGGKFFDPLDVAALKSWAAPF